MTLCTVHRDSTATACLLHDGWREVTEEEYDKAHRYAQRILEDLCDDRPSVETILKAETDHLTACGRRPLPAVERRGGGVANASVAQECAANRPALGRASVPTRCVP